jgi:CHAD domain-containing protein
VIRLDDDPEGVHQARVGTRRLRSDLRTFRPVLDEQWAEDLRSELKWLADELGAVRDADVLLARLRAQVLELPKADQPEGDRLVARLAKERDRAQAGLVAALESPRYPELLDRLVAAAREPHVHDADRRAAKVVPRLVARPWRKLRKTVADLPVPPSDEALHGVRIRAKRARYAADVAVPVVGKAAERFADAVADLQDELGEHHDSIVAEDWLRGAAVAAGGATKAQSLVAGELIAAQRAEAAARRDAWPALWEQASKSKVTAWLA